MAGLDEGIPEDTFGQIAGEDGATLTVEEQAGPDGAVTLLIGGQLDVATATPLGARLEAATRTPGRKLVLDLAGLEFMDSSGIAVLVVAARRSQLQLRNPREMIRRLIEIAGLADVLRIAPDA